MATSDAILRINQDPDGLDFASLRKEAIELVQQLSGKIWTDYNLHDPGVTILEALCYGLTELAYQAGNSVDEYLSDQHGVIDYRRYALYKPHEILPNSAVTPEDYCKLLVDAIPEIDAVHLDADKQHPGVYKLRLKLLESLTAPSPSPEQKAERHKKILAHVRQVFLKNRNLGEDLGEVVVGDARPCFLKGLVETGGRRPRAEILADIFFQCARKISSDIRIERYEDIYAQQKDLGEIFTGPLTHHGYIQGKNSVGVFKPVQELNGVIANIESVKNVYELDLVDAQGISLASDMARDNGYYLQLPSEDHQLDWLTLSYNPGKAADSRNLLTTHPEKSKKLLHEARRYLQRLEFEYNAFRANKNSAASFYLLPDGKAREQLDYYSIQHHFPHVYGINAAGVPSSESNERKLQARQLKAYLYPFEQLMANFQQQIQELRQLFRLDETRLQSYFARYLDNSAIPQIENLYRHNSLVKVRAVQHQYDNFASRKNRALNTALAIYGEVFPDESLAHFNDYHQDDSELWMIENKINYLKHLDRLSSQRAKAFDQTLWPADSLSSFQEKLSILLGLKYRGQAVSLVGAFQDFNVNLVSDRAMAARSQASSDKFQPLPALKPAQLANLKKWEYQPGKQLTLSAALLRDGVYASNYRLEIQADSTQVFLLQNNKPVLLKSFKKTSEAVGYAHKFKKIVTTLNRECEGFHLVEHVLLRPRLQAETEADPALLDSFFNFTLSLVFPAWTARFSNPNFRQYVHSQVNEHLPAHLLPSIYWLGVADMKAFEKLDDDWRAALYQFHHADNQSQALKKLNAAAKKLADWLKQRQPVAEYWV